MKSLRLLGKATNASGRYIDLEKANRIKENAKRDSLAKLDSLAGKDSKKNLTGADSLMLKNSLMKSNFKGLFNRRKDKATQPSESAKAADTTNAKKTEDAQ